MIILIKWFNDKFGFPLRWRYLIRHISPYLKNSNKVLDLGASCGKLAYKLSKKIPNIEFIGIDTHLQPKTFIKIKKYDGKHIPFPNNSFDCVMIIDVLHHDENPAMILKEAGRVTKKYVLIKDHYWQNKLDFILLKFIDYFGNKPYGIALPYNFLRISDWEKMTKESNLKVVESHKFRYSIFDPCKQILYLLEK